MIFKKAVLVIHGFGGSPLSLEFLSSNLSFQKDFDVFTFVLPGHELRDYRLKHEDFIKSACEHIEMLISYGYKDIYVIGHSMGGVIASFIASKYREVKKLVLIAPAFHYLGVKNGKVDFEETLKSGVNILKESKISNFFNKSKSLPINAPLEFVHLVKDYYYAPMYVSVPTLIVWGTSDNVVPFSSALYVFKSLKSRYKYLLVVRGASHNPFISYRREIVTNCILEFLLDNNFKKSDIVRNII